MVDEKDPSSFAESEHPMNGASKILTVSYGTFSCTLEGFEDPFNTMKAIAEYFRDLAAEDRYFGAEPPQPDAAMLHRIAEREIQRRVEAKIQDNGVILRAEETEGREERKVMAPPVAEMPARSAAPAVPKPAPKVAPPVADSTDDEDASTESVAEKLSRLRKAAAASPVAPAAALVVAPAQAAPRAADTDYIEDQHADVAQDTPAALAKQFDDEAVLAAVAEAPLVVEDAPVAEADLTVEPEAVAPAEAEPVAEAAHFTAPEPEAEAKPELVAVPEPVAEAEPVAEVEASEPSEALDLAALQAADPVLMDTPDAIATPETEPETEADDHEALEDLLAMDGASAEDLETVPAEVAESAADEPEVDYVALNAARAARDLDQPAQAAAEDDDAMLANLSGFTVDVPAATDAPSAAIPAQAEKSREADDALLASLGALIDPEDDVAETPAQAKPAEAPAYDAEDAAFYFDDAEDEPETTAENQSPDEASEPARVAMAVAPAQTEAAEDAPEVTHNTDLTEDEPVIAVQQPAAPVRPVRPVRPLRPTLAERPTTTAESDEDGQAALAETESRTPISLEKLQRARARVIKIRRSDAATGQTTPVAAPSAASLSQEAEAALAAELAALERESRLDAAISPALPKDPAPEASGSRRIGLGNDDVAVNRLMDEARSQMEVPDTKRRQSAIAHLRAAVAATIAERRATGNSLAGNGTERMGAYRDDLAKVVRPSAPVAEGPADRPAPLVLVSEQRIDRQDRAPAPLQDVAPVRPTRPRRVEPTPVAPMAAAPFLAADDLDDDGDDSDNIFDVESGFPEFAERLGATELSDLLEAAAAYIACVEGRDSFTRPQLMRHVGAATDDVTREDGLRSFGILLRDGVIERSRRGQFAINEASPLLAEARKIAG